MQPLTQFDASSIQIVFCDIDDTLTTEGKLTAEAYSALWQLNDNQIHVIPVTGRPAGWCEMIARFWPVHGVVGENGGFYFRHKDGSMHRYYKQDGRTRQENLDRLQQLSAKILKEVPGSAIASDQFCRQLDLAIDFCEDVSPLGKDDIQKIVDIFNSAGATAKVSSIHVNGWFGDFNKLSMVKTYCERELDLEFNQAVKVAAFIGDSPNDEPMFEGFTHSFAVANIKEFSDQLQHRPEYVTNSSGGKGFVEFVAKVLDVQSR